MRTTFAFALALLAAGCAASGTADPSGLGDDDRRIAELVEQLNDDGGRAKQLKPLFATGAAVPAAKTLQLYRFDLKGKPSVSGTAATATVVLEKHKGGEPVEKPWEFVKEGDKWKIKSAPLP